MTTTINHLIKTLKPKGKLLTHRQDQSADVSQYYCSCYVGNENLLVKGETRNPRQKERNALLMFFDLKTQKLRGESRLVSSAYWQAEGGRRVPTGFVRWATSDSRRRPSCWLRGPAASWTFSGWATSKKRALLVGVFGVCLLAGLE